MRKICLLTLSLALLVPACSKDDSKSAERIHRVETGVPAIAIDFRAGVPWEQVGSVPGNWNIVDRMNHYSVPGVGVAVVDDYSVVWARGYGRLAAGSADSVTTLTPFEAASTTKAVVAIAVLFLVEKGVLDLDGDVDAFLTSWKIPESDSTAEQKVTVRRLLTHTAGLNLPPGGFSTAEDGVPTTLQVVRGELPATNAPLAVERVPGTVYAYSNFGYLVLQQALADAAGKPFTQVMAETVFGPLGLTDCSFDPESRWQESMLPRPHSPRGQALRSFPNHNVLGPGGLWATPSDLGKVAVAIMNGYRGRSGEAVSPQVARWMLTKAAEIDQATNLGFSGMGFGVYLIPAGDGTAFCHPGFNDPGATSMLIGFPETGQGAVVMTNGARGLELTLEILASIAREYNWPHIGATSQAPAPAP